MRHRTTLLVSVTALSLAAGSAPPAFAQPTPDPRVAPPLALTDPPARVGRVAYTEGDVRELLALKVKSDAGGFVTTEKDAINLGTNYSALHPLAVVPVKMELLDAANAVDTMLRIVAERQNPT